MLVSQKGTMGSPIALTWNNGKTHITRDLDTELSKKQGYLNYVRVDQEIFVLS